MTIYLLAWEYVSSALSFYLNIKIFAKTFLGNNDLFSVFFFQFLQIFHKNCLSTINVDFFNKLFLSHFKVFALDWTWVCDILWGSFIFCRLEKLSVSGNDFVVASLFYNILQNSFLLLHLVFAGAFNVYTTHGQRTN